MLIHLDGLRVVDPRNQIPEHHVSELVRFAWALEEEVLEQHPPVVGFTYISRCRGRGQGRGRRRARIVLILAVAVRFCHSIIGCEVEEVSAELRHVELNFGWVTLRHNLELPKDLNVVFSRVQSHDHFEDNILVCVLWLYELPQLVPPVLPILLIC